jgi:hypothetical protein
LLRSWNRSRSCDRLRLYNGLHRRSRRWRLFDLLLYYLLYLFNWCNLRSSLDLFREFRLWSGD